MSPSMLTAPLTQPLRQRAPNPQNAEVADFSMPRFITRQPLLDNAFSIIGYELKVNQAGPLPVLPGATSLRQIQDEALLVSVIDLEYQQALSRRLTLLNVNSETLDNPLLDKLPRESAILAVHPQNPTPALLARCQTLAREGYALALDEAALMPGMIPLAICLDVGVFVAGQPLQVYRSIVQRLIVDVVYVIAAAPLALFSGTGRQKRLCD